VRRHRIVVSRESRPARPWRSPTRRCALRESSPHEAIAQARSRSGCADRAVPYREKCGKYQRREAVTLPALMILSHPESGHARVRHAL
jgi:hypothetical protein